MGFSDGCPAAGVRRGGGVSGAGGAARSLLEAEALAGPICSPRSWPCPPPAAHYSNLSHSPWCWRLTNTVRGRATTSCSCSTRRWMPGDRGRRRARQSAGFSFASGACSARQVAQASQGAACHPSDTKQHNPRKHQMQTEGRTRGKQGLQVGVELLRGGGLQPQLRGLQPAGQLGTGGGAAVGCERVRQGHLLSSEVRHTSTVDQNAMKRGCQARRLRCPQPASPPRTPRPRWPHTARPCAY